MRLNYDEREREPQHGSLKDAAQHHLGEYGDKSWTIATAGIARPNKRDLE